ncbi:hypothetical protein T484DRAFT_1799510, partial [Baffinella frigidus]
EEEEELAELVEAHGKKGEVDFTNFVKMVDFTNFVKMVLGTQSKLQLGQKGQAIKLLSKQKLQKLQSKLELGKKGQAIKLLSKQKLQKMQKMQDAFREFDLDGSGAIDAEELLEDAFREFDLDGSGAIDAEEHLEARSMQRNYWKLVNARVTGHADAEANCPRLVNARVTGHADAEANCPR